MAPLTPYRTLSAERRTALVAHAVAADPQLRASFAQRVVARGGGFRAATVRQWPTVQLAREVVRRSLETPQDEFALLHTLFVDLEPEVQIAFLDAAGVRHDAGKIPEDLTPPLAEAAAVRRAAEAVLGRFGDDGRRYLATIALYNAEAWPGIDAALA